ncbi:beta-1 adrenergic receptor-like [Haliotis cracherodii]|uniref:beta-1 adrenergic receptor-like n=1 Tax=Haliotis cracherodii TaxID=6455 RepID=UPI0039ED24A6
METFGLNQTEDYVSAVVDLGDRMFGIFGAILAIWIIVSNSILIISILMDDTRRRNLFWLLIINLAVDDLLRGVAIVPFTSHNYYTGYWAFGGLYCQVWTTSDILLSTVSIVVLVVISCERLVYLKHISRTTRRVASCCLTCLIITFPWATGAVIATLQTNVGSTFAMYDNQCYYDEGPISQRVSIVISFFIPTFVSICVNIGILMNLGELRHLQDESPKKQIVGVVIVSVVYVLMWAPLNVLSFLNTNIVYSSSYWLAFSNSGVTPLLWLVSPKVREGYWALLRCRGRGQQKRTEKVDEVTMSTMS